MEVIQVAIIFSGVQLIPSFNDRFIVLQLCASTIKELFLIFTSVIVYTYLFLIVCGPFSSFISLFSGSLIVCVGQCVKQLNEMEIRERKGFYVWPFLPEHLGMRLICILLFCGCHGDIAVEAGVVWGCDAGGHDGCPLDPLSLSLRSQCTSFPTQAHWKNMPFQYFYKMFCYYACAFATLSNMSLDIRCH